MQVISYPHGGEQPPISPVPGDLTHVQLLAFVAIRYVSSTHMNMRQETYTHKRSIMKKYSAVAW